MFIEGMNIQFYHLKKNLSITLASFKKLGGGEKNNFATVLNFHTRILALENVCLCLCKGISAHIGL